MKRFEYKVAMFAINDFLPKLLNDFGEQGWENYAVFPIEEELECNKYYRYFFKRELPEGEGADEDETT